MSLYLALCALAIGLGLPIGFPIGLVKSRFIRAPMLPILMILPPFCYSIYVLRAPLSPNDDIGPVFWIPMVLVVYAIPLVFWCISTGCGYYLGRKRWLDREAERDGIIG
jgi:hypothetical protein